MNKTGIAPYLSELTPTRPHGQAISAFGNLTAELEPTSRETYTAIPIHLTTITITIIKRVEQRPRQASKEAQITKLHILHCLTQEN